MDVQNYVENAFEKYADTVYRLALLRTKNVADAEDILQEVFMRYMKRGNRAETDEHERALLIRITVNCTNTLFTGAFRRHTVALDEGLTAAEDAPRHDTVDAVMTLPQKYRTVIHLHYFEGYSVEEIATLLNTKPSTVKSWLHRGREKLRGMLEGVD